MSVMGVLYRGATTLTEPLTGPGLRLLARNESPSLRTERVARDVMEPVDTWWHAASLGEVEALKPVLELAQEQDLVGRFVVTTTSPTGREEAARHWPGHVGLAPLDFPRAMGRAMRARRPRSLVLVETELWPNWLHMAFRTGTPVGVINGRISNHSWRRYRRWAGLFRPLVSRLAAIAVRYEKDAERFLVLGARPESLCVAGNTKHDRLAPATPARLPWTKATLWTIGSLRRGEESLIEAFGILKPRHPRLKLAIVPRHPKLWPNLVADLRAKGFTVAVRSDPQASDSEADILVVDTHGELGAYYAASAVAFVGGTWAPIGGHNVLEPALSGVPVLVGPHLSGVEEEARGLESAGGLVQAASVEKAVEVLDSWLTDPDRRSRAGEAARRATVRFRGGSRTALEWLIKQGVLSPVESNG